ncbi:MAG: nuclease domain-containing protein, partial [Coriobacteriia bacterium]|nr:nuclease domain-containing protein [Coriobacteriia bacterium]
EYWCFFEMAEQIRRLGLRPLHGVPVGGGEMSATLNEGIKLVFEDGVELHYNRSFSRSNTQWRSYSVTLRPDIVLKVGDTLHLFDAKFRIDRWAVEDFDAGAAANEAVENDDRAGRASAIWWKNADIHKMHAYRDALGRDGAHVATVRVLYPGTQEVFYPSQPGGVEGVGAVPLVPGASADQLRTVLGGLLIPPN